MDERTAVGLRRIRERKNEEVNLHELEGQKFGLVTVVRRDPWALRGNPPLFAVCECGRGRWFFLQHLKEHPPKTHRQCRRGFLADAPELPFDSVQ